MKRCARCGGTGHVTRGNVINGVCYGCGGSGGRRHSPRANRASSKIQQWALVDGDGRHLAINTDRDSLESLRKSIPGEIVPLELLRRTA